MDASLDKNCMLCDAPDIADKNMVQCDDCKMWAHFRCAEVDEEIWDKPWSCPKCTNLLRVPDQQKPKKTSKRSGANKSDSGSVKSLVSAIEELEKEQGAKEKALEEEMAVREKRMELERALKMKQLHHEREMRERELKQERELQELQLLQEREMLEKRLHAEEEFLKRRTVLRERFETAKDEVKSKWAENEGAVGGLFDNDQQYDVQETLLNAADSEDKQMKSRSPKYNTKHPLGAYPKGTTPAEIRVPSKKQSRLEQIKALLEQQSEEESDDGDGSQETFLSRQEAKVREGNGPGQLVSQEQLAARQFMSKQLPIFRGEPEMWPLFISSFENTTEACGLSKRDNLKRLQDCLQGDALEAVRSYLIYPESVPGVIKDLRDLFGKPKKIMKALLAKVRAAPLPDSDHLESFIHFGLTVKQLCDHLEAAGLTDHLNNPLLVDELVDRLPPNDQRDWVRYQNCSQGTPLRMFTNFISGVISEVSEVVDYTPVNRNEPTRGRNQNNKKKKYIHVHSAPSKREPSLADKTVKPCWMCKRSDYKLRFCDGL